MAASSNDTVLLVMDLINNIVAMLPETEAYLARASRCIAAARENKIPVIHVTIDFRRNYPEVPRTSPFWARIASTDAFVNAAGQPNRGVEFAPEAAPLPDEIVVSRKRISAFCSSDLEVILRSMGARNLVLAGLTTSGVVLSTVRDAMDRNYGITVLEDLCMDRDEEVHRVLTTKVFPTSGAVLKWEDWISQL